MFQDSLVSNSTSRSNTANWIFIDKTPSTFLSDGFCPTVLRYQNKNRRISSARFTDHYWCLFHVRVKHIGLRRSLKRSNLKKTMTNSLTQQIPVVFKQLDTAYFIPLNICNSLTECQSMLFFFKIKISF